MKRVYHILNGDALKEQFPFSILGQRIVMRECMVDGDVSGSTPDEIFSSRTQFMAEHYQNVTPAIYYKKTTPEFYKMRHIPDDAEVHLWFEHDLFCQVNLWFVLYYLDACSINSNVFLVYPTSNLQFGFGGMDTEALIEAFKNRKALTNNQISIFVKLWRHYQDNNLQAMSDIGNELGQVFPFLKAAINAHIERFPTLDYPGRPQQTILNLMKELETNDFGSIFRAFNERESIYGFGDLQVRRMFDKLTQQD